MKALAIKALWVLGYVWAFPVTLTGLLAALVGWARPFEIREGAVLCVASPGGLWDFFFRKGHFIAATWGGVIVLCSDYWEDNEAVLRHELRHFAQARVLGVLMPVAYGLCSLWAWLHGQDAYSANALEADARRAAERG